MYKVSLLLVLLSQLLLLLLLLLLLSKLTGIHGQPFQENFTFLKALQDLITPKIQEA